MAIWYVDFLIEPRGREVTVQVRARDSVMAMISALILLEIDADELLHTLRAHISRPIRVDDEQ
jgi:hypothetical protein